LGKSGISVSVVGIGTGTHGSGGSSLQTRLGQEVFTKIVRHALDAGIVFFDLADSYGSNAYFAEAMKGVPRDRYVIQTKTDTRDPKRVRDDIDRFLRELKTDHVDSLIVHCVTEADWPKRYAGVLDAFSEARAAGKIRAHGVTCHSWEALEAAAASDWVQVHQVRWNPGRAHMDGDVEDARSLFAGMRRKGQGMIGMKVVGQGDIVGRSQKLTPDDCFRFQLESGVVDAFVVGVDSTAQVDALVSGTQTALDSVGYRRIDLA
jgi:aryl-alcohol dehydrogenase-like predicted oxidoreductase